MITPTQRVCADVPQILLEALQDYLAKHPDWDKNRVLAAALSLILLQNAEGDRRASKVYLDTLIRPSSPSGINGDDGVIDDMTGGERKVESGAAIASPLAPSPPPLKSAS